MDINFERALAATPQSPLADEIVTVFAAVVSNASAPDFAIKKLEKTRQDSIAPEHRAAAAALQAYGLRYAAEVLGPGLEPQAVACAEQLRESLEEETADDALDLLASKPDVGAEFKSRLSLAIASKCAELVAAEIERAKNGPFTILNEDDARIFETRHAEHQKQRNEAARNFLSSLPSRFPSFGAALFAQIRSDVECQIKDKYARPDIHKAVAAMFDDAVAAMAQPAREEIARHGTKREMPGAAPS